MKILVFSDTHGYVQPVMNIVSSELPDVVIHLGDCLKDAKALSSKYPHMPVYSVRGNNDFNFSINLEKELIISGKKLFLTHGHAQYNVKNGLSSLISAAYSREADIVMFGHTHKAYYEFNGKLHILNPGAVFMPSNGIKTYAELIIDDEINVKIKEL